MTGWIKLYRKFLKWEWYEDHNTTRLFLHLLLTANFHDSNWRGQKIKRGQRVFSRKKLAADVGITEQELRTSLKYLKKTGEIEVTATSKFSVVTLCKYESYQGEKNHGQPAANQQITSKLTNKQPADNQDQVVENTDTYDHGQNHGQPAANQQKASKLTTYKEDKKIRNKKKDVRVRPKISKNAAAAVHEFYLIWKSKTFKDALREVYENFPAEKAGIAAWLKYKDQWGRSMNAKPDNLKELADEAYQAWQQIVGESEFEDIWADYPKKVGKKEAFRHFRSSVKSQDDIDRMRNALENYLKSDRVLRGYVQDGKTWFNNWKDWYDKDR